jgi:hypothetical protein
MLEDRASDKARNSGKLLKSPDRGTTRRACARRWRAERYTEADVNGAVGGARV